MGQYLPVTKKLITSIVLLFIFMFANSDFAQNRSASDAPPQPMGVTEIKVKPGMDMEWENFLKKELIPILKKAGFKQMNVSKTNIFGEDSTYFFL